VIEGLPEENILRLLCGIGFAQGFAQESVSHGLCEFFNYKGGVMAKKATRSSGHKLIVSDATAPSVAIPLKEGMKFEIVSVTTVNDKLAPAKVGARLCGGSGTCLAIVDIAAPRINPNPTRKR